MSQPDNLVQWHFRYLLQEAVRTGAKLKLDKNGEILIFERGGWQLLTEQTSFREVSDGKRRGYNGKQPRTSDGIKHPCTVTRADGTTYDFYAKTRNNMVRETPAQKMLKYGRPTNDMNPDA